MVYTIKYKKVNVKPQSFTLNIDPSSVKPRISADGNEYITVWLVERQAFRSLRLDRMQDIQAISEPDAVKSAIKKAKKAYRNFLERGE